MKYNLSKGDIEPTAQDMGLIEKKMERIGKLLDPHAVIDIRIARDTHHAKGEVIACILNARQGKDVLHAERQGENIQVAFDEALAALKQQLKKVRDKRANTR